MNNQKLTWSNISNQIELTDNFQDLMQLYLDTHQEAALNGKTLTYDDFNFLRILFNSRFNELKHIETIKRVQNL